MKRNKSLLLGLLLSITVIFLSACTTQATTQTGNNDGFFHNVFVEPFSYLLQGIAEIFNGSYGLAIILMTLLIRFALMPLMLKQYKNQQHMKEKMELLKPEMNEIQMKLKNTKDQKEQQKLQQEMMGLYKKHNVNPLSIGCLPMLIQMPILMGFYYAIRGSSEIANHTFLWFSLGQPDIWITAAAGIIYYLQFKVSSSTMTAEQQTQMKFMGLLSPIMIVMFSLNAPAALPLYWTIGGTFLIIQTYISKKMYYSEPNKETKPNKA
ncbi:membrane protein insertase YidC [Bacillus massilinigeriensis]|uniref:membrane protein insertase YidC n=1 Tax=Bacillus massilionigeriensis TaxID=1805475 RepID=UPI00096B401E|nr:membrane protein insertase YidC [Bacillus massilionigeriensis]